MVAYVNDITYMVAYCISNPNSHTLHRTLPCRNGTGSMRMHRGKQTDPGRVLTSQEGTHSPLLSQVQLTQREYESTSFIPFTLALGATCVQVWSCGSASWESLETTGHLKIESEKLMLNTSNTAMRTIGILLATNGVRRIWGCLRNWIDN